MTERNPQSPELLVGPNAAEFTPTSGTSTADTPVVFSAAAVNAASEPSLPNTSEPTVDGLTGMQWCHKHGLVFQFDLPAIRVSDKDGKILGMAYSANGTQGLIEAIRAVKQDPRFSKA